MLFNRVNGKCQIKLFGVCKQVALPAGLNRKDFDHFIPISLDILPKICIMRESGGRFFRLQSFNGIIAQ